MSARWVEKVRLADVFHNDAMTFPEIRDCVVGRIKATRWYKQHDTDDSDLVLLVDELSDVTDADEFDSVWDAIYDVADADRVWIETS